MKRKIKELKRIARGNLQGNYMAVIRAFIFCNIIVTLIEMPFSFMTNDIQFSTQNIIYYIAIALISIASVVLLAGQYRIHLQLARTGQIHLSELFVPIKNYSNVLILTELILLGISLLCTVPLIGAIIIIYLYKHLALYITAAILILLSLILLVYVSITFDLVFLVINDNIQITPIKALTQTKEMVKKNKGRYLYMQLSFLGMALLVGFTFGIGMLWVQPYMMHTTTLFYLDVKGELDAVLENKLENTPEPIIFDHYA